MSMIPKNTSSSNFTDTFSSIFSVLGLCRLLKVAGFRKRAGYGASVSELLFSVLSSCFYDSNKTIHGNYSSTKKSNICTSKAAYIDFFPTAIITGESLFCF